MTVSFADAIFWLAVACCVVAQLAIVRSAIVSPVRVADGHPVSAVRRVSEIAWAVIPGIALAVVLVFTWRAIHAVPGSAAILRDKLQ
jgi:heme/copper-type cytochrome/quinol oxidase subunit 2